MKRDLLEILFSFILSAMIIATFWISWFILKDEVPVFHYNLNNLSKSFDQTLYISRWWDILAGGLYVAIVTAMAKIVDSEIKMFKTEWQETKDRNTVQKMSDWTGLLILFLLYKLLCAIGSIFFLSFLAALVSSMVVSLLTLILGFSGIILFCLFIYIANFIVNLGLMNLKKLFV
jgi:hypothetical protein